MYSFIKVLVQVLISLINGKVNILNKEKLPEGNYILVGPHRSWWDPVWYALSAQPKRFIFMAKKELFKNKLAAKFLKSLGAFEVDRNNAGPSVIKYPVNELRKGNRSLLMFPTGSRHSAELKAGVLLIAKMSGKPIVPAVYQGPVKFSKLFSLRHRNSTYMAFGDPIYVPKGKLTDEEQAKILEQIQQAFDDLDKQINPDFVYVDPNPKN